MKKTLSQIQVSKFALLGNIWQFKKLLPKGNKLVLVVKANAYGHGIKEIVTIANKEVDAFQVDDIEELRTIRQITNKEVFVFGYVQRGDLKELVNLNGVLGCYSVDTIKYLGKIAKTQNKKIKIHLKIDALLGRQGIFEEDLVQILKAIKEAKHILLESVYSHFSNIEDVNDLSHAQKQFDYLIKAKEIAKNHGFKNVAHHISATSGLMTDLDNNWESCLVRLGIGAYGLWPSGSLRKKLNKKIKLTPVLSWKSSVAQIKIVPKDFPIGYGLTFVTKKSTKIAVIPQGYSDGYDRGLSNNSYVLIRGKKCKVLGRVAMNMFVVDISEVKNVKVEDEVVLIGGQGSVEITPEIIAESLGTINYEVVARLNPLIPRIIVK